MKEYKYSKLVVIITNFIVLIMVGWFVWFLSSQPDHDLLHGISWVQIIVSLIVITIMSLLVLDVHRSRFVIHSNSIKSTYIFFNKELKFKEIKGFRITQNNLVIEPHDNKNKKIKVDKYISGYDEILEWLSENYLNIDQVSAWKQEYEIFNNEDLGTTHDMITVKLRSAKIKSKVLNWFSVIISFWFIFYPSPYELILLIATVVPIVAVILIKTSNGLIQLAEEKVINVYPTVLISIVLLSFVVFLRATFDYNILNYDKLWMLAFELCILYFVILISNQKEIKFKKVIDIFFVVMMFIIS